MQIPLLDSDPCKHLAVSILAAFPHLVLPWTRDTLALSDNIQAGHCHEENSPDKTISLKSSYKAEGYHNEELTDISTMFTSQDKREKNENIFTKRQIIKNLLVLSIGFLVISTSYGSMSVLQSSLNMKSGIGSGSLAVIYAGLIVSCLFLPPFMIAQFGCKWTMPICTIGYILYMGANFYPVWATMAPTAVLIGLGAAALWSAKCTYLTTMGVWYAKMMGVSEDAMINRFFGIFYMFFQSNQIWGNILISNILTPSGNTTVNLSESDQHDAICGAKFCPLQIRESNNTNLERPVETKIYILCGVFVALAITGTLIIIIFLDAIKLPNRGNRTKSRCVSPGLFMVIFKHIVKSRYQLLLVPLTLYTGMEQAFIRSDFTRAYITCTLGIQNVGYVMICHGVSDAVCSIAFGQLVELFGHISFFVIGFLLHGACQIAFLLWEPDKNDIYMFYILVGLWGMGDAVMQTQMNALYGLLFKDNLEAGFANYKLWESTGFLLQYAFNDFICTSTKLYISLAFFIIGICCYSAVEVRYYKQTKFDKATKEQSLLTHT